MNDTKTVAHNDLDLEKVINFINDHNPDVLCFETFDNELCIKGVLSKDLLISLSNFIIKN